MHHPTDRIAHTTAFVTPVVEQWLEREIAQWLTLDRLDEAFRVTHLEGARCSSVVRALTHGAMGRRIYPSWWTH